MARNSIDITYAPKNPDEAPRTPGRPVVHSVDDRRSSQSQATPVALRIDNFGTSFQGKDGKDYTYIRATYLHAQETDQKEAQPYTALTSRPKYDGNHLLVHNEDGSTAYTNDCIMPLEDLKAMVAASTHPRDASYTKPDAKAKKTANGNTLRSLYIAAPLEFATDNLAPADRNTGRKPTYLRPIASRAEPITEAIVPDPKFWTEVDGQKRLNIPAIDEFQTARSKELQPERDLIRAGRGKEIVSKLTGKPFGESKSAPAAEAPDSAHGVAPSNVDALFDQLELQEFETEAPAPSAKDSYADSLTEGKKPASKAKAKDKGPEIGV